MEIDKDSILDDASAAKLLSTALVMILSDKEGIVVEGDNGRKFGIINSDNGINICDDETFQQFEVGQMIAARFDEETAAERNRLEAMGFAIDPNNLPEIH